MSDRPTFRKTHTPRTHTRKALAWTAALAALLAALPLAPSLADSDAAGQADQDANAEVSLYPAPRDGLWGFIDRTGTFVIPPTYKDRPREFTEGFARIRVNGRFGFINTAGDVVIEPRFNAAEPFSERWAAVKFGRYTGYIDARGQWHLRGRFRRVSSFKNGLAEVVDANNRRQLIDHNGRNALPTSYQNLRWAGNWPVVVLHDGEWYFVGREGGRAQGGTFKLMFPSPEGITIASPDKKTWHFLNPDRDLLFKLQAQRVLPVSDAAAAVFNDGRWRFVNMKGETIGDQQFKKIVQPGFVEGWAGVFDEDGKLGYIDKSGAFAIPPKYDDGEPFRDGLALVKLDNHHLYIDRDGEVVWPKPDEQETQETQSNRDEQETAPADDEAEADR